MISRLCIFIIGILCLVQPLFATVGGGYSYTDFYYDPITHELIYVWNDESEAGRGPIIKHQTIDDKAKENNVLGLYERLKQSIPSENDYDTWEQKRSQVCEKYGVRLQNVDLEKYDFQYEAIESWGKDMTFANLNAFINKYTEEEIKGSAMGAVFGEGRRYSSTGAEIDDMLKTVINFSISDKKNEVTSFSIPAIMGYDHIILKGFSYPGASFLIIIVKAFFTVDEGGYMGDYICVINDIKIPRDSFVKDVKKTEVKISNANLNKTKLSQLLSSAGMAQYHKQLYYAASYFFNWAYSVDNSNLQAKDMLDQIIKIQNKNRS